MTPKNQRPLTTSQREWFDREGHIRLVHKYALTHGRRFPLEHDEIVGILSLHVLRLIPDYDPRRARFSTLCYLAFGRLLNDACRNRQNAAERSAWRLTEPLADHRQPGPLKLLTRAEDRARLRIALDAIGERERDMVSSYYGLGERDPETLRAIGERHGVSHERVRQLIVLALAEMRGVLRVSLEAAH